jgi:hypothetical protein
MGLPARSAPINAGIVTVTMADGATITEDQAKQIIEDAGFTLRGFEEMQAQAGSERE